MVVFTAEIFLSLKGRADYPGSFFMVLDIIATVSMLLDITWFVEHLDTLFEGEDSDDGNANSLRSGRSAKIGAKVARIVRVVRLVRIVKLYKAYHDARLERLRKKERLERERQGIAPGEFDDWDEEDLQDNRVRKDSQESQIGKKLSDLTIRLLIILILALLLVLPFLAREEVNLLPFSADYGADAVWQAFEAYEQGSHQQEDYEESMLKYIYYHNWFAYEEGQDIDLDSAKNSYSQLFWVGVSGKNDAAVTSKAATANIREATFTDWRTNARANDRHTDAMYSYGAMPQQVHGIITGDWSTRCDKGSFFTLGFSMLAQKIPDVLSHAIGCPDDLRYQESLKYAPQTISNSQYNEYHLAFWFDIRPFIRQESVLGLATTSFVLVLLIAGSLWFMNGSNKLLVHPLEEMMTRVKEIQQNPMNAMKMSDEEFKAEQREKVKRHLTRKYVMWSFFERLMGRCCEWPTEELMETSILEKTIIKLGSLLVLGFGEAGANIISHNLSGGNTVGVDAMVPGELVHCIIGVARIRDFSAATEVLQSKIMTFVNQIAEIVHGVASEFHAAPNRNSGDVFLLVWRDTEEEDSSTTRLAELSLVACAKMLAALHRSPLLATYRKHPGLQNRLGENCQVNMSFGLHSGWAVEGAVGSEFKIDASYVSPNVTVAYSVEAATRAYKVSLIASQAVTEWCSPPLLSKLRRIDCVHVAGSREPIEFFCMDLDCRCVRADDSEKPVEVWNTRTRFKARQFLENEKKSTLSPDYYPAEEFKSDKVIAAMRRRYNEEFLQLFSMGYQNYKEGEWEVASTMLHGSNARSKSEHGDEDGPSEALLHFMASHDFQAPKTWNGIREFAELSVD
jgi:class 3 adenylate cyclase